jgi:thymidylate synthase ThyX
MGSILPLLKKFFEKDRRNKMKLIIHNSFGHDNSLIKQAACVAYQSEDTSKKTAHEMVEFLKRKEHLSPLEFSWYIIRIRVAGLQEDREKIINEIFNAFLIQRYFKVSFDDIGMLISGNGRAWYEYFRAKADMKELDSSILSELSRYNNALFGTITCGKRHPRYLIEIMKENNIGSFSPDNKRIHNWVTIKAEGVSRGLTAEYNRHRSFSTMELSTRYVKMEEFGFTFSDKQVSDKHKKMLDAWLLHTKNLYSVLLEEGFTKNEVRHILPLGTNVSIFKAARILDWEDFFLLRGGDALSHFEIKALADELKLQFTNLKLIG